jgi:hypothetical protein
VISLRLGLRGCCAEACTPCLQARIGTRADRPTPTVKGMFAEDLLRDKICTYRLDNGSFIDGTPRLPICTQKSLAARGVLVPTCTASLPGVWAPEKEREGSRVI